MAIRLMPKRISRVLKVFIANGDLMFKKALMNIIIIVLSIAALVINVTILPSWQERAAPNKETKMRKISFPIHFKLIGFTLALLAASLGFYVYYAVDLFKTDKVAYVFESVSSQNEQVAQGINNKIENAFSMASLLNKAKNSTKLAKEIFDKNPALIGYLEFTGDKLDRSVFSRDLENSARGIDIKAFRSFLKSRLAGDKGMELVEFQEQKFFMTREGSYLSLWEPDFLNKAFPQSSLYHYGLILNAQFSAREKLSEGDSNEIPQELIAAIKEKDKVQQAFVFSALKEEAKEEANEKGKKAGIQDKRIVAMEGLSFGDGVVFTTVNYQKAIQASLRLRDKSLFFGLFTAGISILLVLLFSRFFTRPIEKLFKASQKFSKRDFSHRVELNSKDELGVLGDSFNHMAGEISHYMEEMKEKSRLENELKTAQLVQKSFFPRDSIEGDRLNLKAFYRPATECGGDWWGYLSFGSTETIIMIDVTGHGTAAALVTAVVHNSLTSLKYIGEKDPDFLKSPARVMGFLNESLLSVDVNLFATAFVLSLDNQTRKIRYSNASHNPPYVIPAKEDLGKGDFKPLMDQLGPRLGEEAASEYHDVELEIKSGDKVLLYTDGILELENPSSKAYGTRRFIKKLIEQAKNDVSVIVEKSIEDAFTFAQEIEPKDDMTLICLELK